MKISGQEWLIAGVNLASIIGFALYYISIRNFEFLWYIAVLVFFFLLIGLTLKSTKFPAPILWGLTAWGLLHMAGGGIPISGEVLYKLHLIPLIDGGGEYFVLKYDQAVHFLGFFVSALVVHHLLYPRLDDAGRKSVLVLFWVAMASVGLSVLNEIVEFAAVIALGKTGVGGYGNTLLDLVFNTLGALSAVVVLYFRKARTF